MTATAARRVTVVLIVGSGLVWLGWDVFVGAAHFETESQVIAQWVRAANSLAFFLGAWVAHLAWHNRNPHYDWWPYAVACLLAAIVWDALTTTWHVKGAAVQLIHVPTWMRHPGLWLLLGLPAGHWLWPQREKEEEPT